MLRILVVCRGSSHHGLGHVMRARSVARQMSLHADVRLVVLGDEFVEGLLKGHGLTYRMAADEAEVLQQVTSFQPHVVAFDTLEMTAEVVESINQQAMTVSLSPVFNGLAEMDLIFHRTRYRGDDWPREPVRPKVFAGLEYAVVRENCVKIPYEQFLTNLRQQPLSVMVSMGGADAGNKTLRVLESLRELPCPLLIWALLGEGYAHSYEALVDAVATDRKHEIILAKTSDSMWRVMQTCSLAVLAGGTVTYEAAFAGLPSINLFEHAWQTYLTQELEEADVCMSAGFPFDQGLAAVSRKIQHLEEHRHELLAMHCHANGLLDGQGAARIADEIAAYYWSEYLSRGSEKTRVLSTEPRPRDEQDEPPTQRRTA